MIESKTAKEFWEQKILRWENSRYSKWRALSPLSWSVRARLNTSTQAILERTKRDVQILELGCGSGHLAARLLDRCSSYHGIDIATVAIQEASARVSRSEFSFVSGDVLETPWPKADLTVFLGLTDWLEPEELVELFQKIESPAILFSFTEASSLNPYRVYRRLMDSPTEGPCQAKMYSRRQIEEILKQYSYSADIFVAPTLANPGGLVWATKNG